MKTKIFTPLLCLLMLAIVAGCNWHKSKIAAEAKQLNDECPKSLGNGMMLTSVELDHDFMVYNVSVNAETFVDVVENAKSPLASKMFSSMIVDDLDADERQVLLDAEVGIKYVYKCETGETRTVTVTVSSQEFAEAVKHPLKGKALLDVQLSILKGRLPMDVGAGMKMVNAEFKNGNLCCEIDVTSAGLEMSELHTITEKMRAADMFTKDDIQNDPLLNTAINQGYNILYIYTHDHSSAQAKVFIPNRDLKALL